MSGKMLRSLRIAFVALGAAQLQEGAPWPAWGAGVHHLNASTRVFTRESAYAWGNGTWGNYASWSAPLSAAIESTPAIDSIRGRIFVGVDSGSVFCLSLQGVTLWHFHSPLNASGVFSSPALSADGSLVYIGIGGNAMYALSAADGSVLWTFGLQSPGDPYAHWQSSPVVSVSGAVLFATFDHRIHAVDGVTGASLWSVETSMPTLGSGAIGADGQFYIGADSGLLALNSSSGAVLWRTGLSPEPIPTVSSPAVGAGGVVFMATCDDTLHALNGTTGMVLWRYPMSAALCLAIHYQSSPCIGHGGLVVVGSLDLAVFAFDATSGLLRWRTPVLANVFGSPIIDTRGAVFVATTAGVLLMLDGATGAVVWDSPLVLSSDRQTTTPVLAPRPDGTVVLYVGSSIGVLNAFVSGCPSPGEGLACRCVAGAQYYPAGFCIPCPPGSFSSAPASYVCDLCPSGTFSSASGATSCEICPLGQESSANATLCFASPPLLRIDWKLTGPLLVLLVAAAVVGLYWWV